MHSKRRSWVPAIAIAAFALGCARHEDAGTESPPSSSNDGGTIGFMPDTGGLPTQDPGLPITPYAAGAIMPSGDRAALTEATAQTYAAWKTRFLVEGCEGFYVDPLVPSTDPHTQTAVSVSELHGMAMITTALLANRDADAHRIFDGLYAYLLGHPSVGSRDLMASGQVAGCLEASDGAYSSTDGDIDVAYGLLLADKQWGSAGAIDYASEARRVLKGVQRYDIDPNTKLPLLGDWVTPGLRREGNAARTTDFMVDRLRMFGAVTGDAFWSSALDAQWSAIAGLQGFSGGSGLLPDFVVDTYTSPSPSPSKWFEASTDGWFASKASRVPLRLATDWLISGDARAQTVLQRLNGWIRAKTGDDPTQINAGYRLDGTMITASVVSDSAFVAPFGVAAMTDYHNQAWLDAIWTLLRTTSVDAENGYSASLRLHAMIIMSGNWYVPVPARSGGT